MKFPKPRGNLKWWGFCGRGQGCTSTCDASKSESKINEPWYQKTIVKRAEIIQIEWNRENHPGGFVKLAITTLDKSDDQGEFDKNVVKYVCFETNCKEDRHVDLLGPLNGPGYSKCTTDFKIPSNIPDGAATIQWTWYGGGIFQAEQNTSFGNYVSCGDIIVQGGVAINSQCPTPYFRGGDAANPSGNQCRYWSSNKPGECANGFEQKEACGRSEPKFGAPSGLY